MPKFDSTPYTQLTTPARGDIQGLIKDISEADPALETKYAALEDLLKFGPWASKVRSVTASGTVSLADTDPIFVEIDPNGSDRDVSLPTKGDDNHGYFIHHVGSANTLTVKRSGGTSIATITAGNITYVKPSTVNDFSALSGGGGSGAGFAGISNLIAKNNGTTPNTKYDFMASEVILKNPSTGGIVAVTSGATITCDISLPASGSISTANGSDQSKISALSNVWVHFYYIYDGATLATLASQNAPSSGPTLPSGYTSWAYIGAVRLDGSSHLLLTRINGNRLFYEIDASGANRVLSAGTATSFTAISCSSVIPPNAAIGIFLFQINLTYGSVATVNAFGRPTGSSLSTGVLLNAARVNAAGYGGVSVASMEFPLGTSQQIDYKLSVTPASNGLYVDVQGYIIPNRAV